MPRDMTFIKALVDAYVDCEDLTFRSLILQFAAMAARNGNSAFAIELRQSIDRGRQVSAIDELRDEAGGALALSLAAGCGDNCCVFGRKQGMNTNGGCRCFLPEDRAKRWAVTALVKLARTVGGEASAPAVPS